MDIIIIALIFAICNPYIFIKTKFNMTQISNTNEFQSQQIKFGQNKYIILDAPKQSYYQIYPSKLIMLKIIRYQGIPLISINHCRIKQKNKCFQQINTLVPNYLIKRIDHIQIDYCSSCFVLIKLWAQQHIELYINLLNKNIPLKLFQGVPHCDFGNNIYQVESYTDRIIFDIYQGNSDIVLLNKQKEQIIGSQIYKNNQLIVFEAPKLINYISINNKNNNLNSLYSITSISNNKSIRLIDGIKTSIYLSSNTKNTFLYKNTHYQIGFMTLFFRQKYSKYLSITYKGILNQTKIVQSNILQNFYKNSSKICTLTLYLSEYVKENIIIIQNKGEIDFALGMMPTSTQIINLPLNLQYPTITSRNNAAYFYIDKFSQGDFEVIIKKCSSGDLYLKYAYQYSTNFFNSNDIEGQKLTQHVTIQHVQKLTQSLYLRISTSNFIFYDIQVRKPKKTNKNLENRTINKEILFNITTTNQIKILLNSSIKYQIFYGSNQQDVIWNTYCYQHLFYINKTNNNNVITAKIEQENKKQQYKTIVNIPNGYYLGVKLQQNDDNNPVYYKIAKIVYPSHQDYHMQIIGSSLIILLIITICYLLKRQKINYSKTIKYQ